MEEILDVYERPYDAENPVICMDEQPVQLIKETKQPMLRQAQHKSKQRKKPRAA